MKKLFFVFVFVCGLGFISCGENTKNDNKQDTTVIDTVDTVSCDSDSCKAL